MTKYKSIRNGICATIMAVTPILLSAQIVKHDRLLSFESAEVHLFPVQTPAYPSPTNIIKTVRTPCNGNSSQGAVSPLIKI